VANMAESYKPALAEGSGRSQTCRMVIIVSSVASVDLTIDTTTVMATQDYVDDKIAEHEQSRRHPDASLTAKGFTQLSSATNSTSETLAATPKAVKTVMDETNKKAPLNSPALTGTPTTPTARQGTNNTQIANTAFVMAAIAALVDSSPDALNTLNELAAALGNDPNFATTMTNALAGKQPKDATLTA
ncbi:phage tail protein, partial [Escherichia coli]